MQLEIITLCDAAQIYEGKVSMLGSFDVIIASKLPYKLPQFAFVAKIRFPKQNRKKYKINVDIELPDGTIHEKDIKGEISIGKIERSASIPFLAHFIGISFEKYGVHKARLSLDDQVIGTCEFEVIKPKTTKNKTTKKS